MHTDPRFKKIDSRSARYSRARARLTRRYAAFQASLRKVEEKHLLKIRLALEEAANVKSELESAISIAPDLFKKPRTLTLHGVRVGFFDCPAALDMPKAKAKRAAVVAAIRAKFTPEKIKELGLIVTEEVPASDALLAQFLADEKLQIEEVEFTPAGESVFIKPADHALDKVIKTLLEEGMQKGTASAPAQEEAA